MWRRIDIALTQPNHTMRRVVSDLRGRPLNFGVHNLYTPEQRTKCA